MVTALIVIAETVMYDACTDGSPVVVPPDVVKLIEGASFTRYDDEAPEPLYSKTFR